MIMLDTNICIYVLNNHSNKLRQKFKAHKYLSISSITYAELCYGIENGDPTKKEARWKQLDLFTQRLIIEPWEEDAALYYGKIRRHLKKQGTPIGNNDLLIAAHALCLDLTLVTNDLSDFKRVPDLKIENWV